MRWPSRFRSSSTRWSKELSPSAKASLSESRPESGRRSQRPTKGWPGCRSGYVLVAFSIGAAALPLLRSGCSARRIAGSRSLRQQRVGLSDIIRCAAGTFRALVQEVSVAIVAIAGAGLMALQRPTCWLHDNGHTVRVGWHTPIARSSTVVVINTSTPGCSICRQPARRTLRRGDRRGPRWRGDHRQRRQLARRALDRAHDRPASASRPTHRRW